MTDRTKNIKALISGQVDMGTFGLVELELLAIEKDMEQQSAEITSKQLLKFMYYCGVAGWVKNVDKDKIVADYMNALKTETTRVKSLSGETNKFMVRDRAKMMLELYTDLGRRETEWEKEYFKGVESLVNDILKMT